MGRPSHADVRQCTGSSGSAAGELAKGSKIAAYICKDLGRAKGVAVSLEHLAEFNICMRRFKAYRTFGTARNVVQPDAPPLRCPSCGALDPEFIGTCGLDYLKQFVKRHRAEQGSVVSGPEVEYG